MYNIVANNVKSVPVCVALRCTVYILRDSSSVDYSVGCLDYYEYEPLSTSAQRFDVLSEELSILET